jgi:hypothetical protein
MKEELKAEFRLARTGLPWDDRKIAFPFKPGSILRTLNLRLDMAVITSALEV